jgi:hypothetical protein
MREGRPAYKHQYFFLLNQTLLAHSARIDFGYLENYDALVRLLQNGGVNVRGNVGNEKSTVGHVFSIGRVQVE